MNQECIIAELEAEERRLEAELNKVRDAKQSLLGKGRSYPRSLTVREALLQVLKAQDGLVRRDLPAKLAGVGAPCTANTVQITISRHKDLFRRQGGRVWLR